MVFHCVFIQLLIREKIHTQGEVSFPMTDQMKALLKTWLYRILQKSMILITKLLILLKVSTFCIPFDEF